jgi:hypothetical protein
MTAVLTVMSGMDPHTVREIWTGMVGMVGQLFFRLDYHSGLCGRLDVMLQGEEIIEA